MTKVHIMSGCCCNISANTLNREGYRYRVQIGLFRLYNKAMDLQLRLLEEGYMTEIDRQGELFTVNAGDFADLEEAVLLERYFRRIGYNTLIVAG